MASSEEQNNPKSPVPNNLLLDSASIHLALAQPGASPSLHDGSDYPYNSDLLFTHFSREDNFKSNEAPSNNQILFQERCFYCTVDSFMAGTLTLSWEYIFFKPDYSLPSENNPSNTHTIFIPIDSFYIVEWATTFLPEKIESRPDGWELKLFYSLKPIQKFNEKFTTQNLKIHKTPQVATEFNVTEETKSILEGNSCKDLPLFTSANAKIEENYESKTSNSLQYDLKSDMKTAPQSVQYEICSIFVFNSFTKLDEASQWLSTLLKDKPYCQQIDFNSSTTALDTFLQSPHNIFEKEAPVTRQKLHQDFPVARFESYLKFDKSSNVVPIIADHLLEQLEQHLPIQLTNCTLSLAFSPNIHGVSFSTFYRKLDGQGPFILLIKDNGGTFFGAFVELFEQHSKYYGTNSNFVFTYKKTEYETGDELKIKVFRASSKNNFFIYSDSVTIAIGGGGQYALTIDKSFLRGSSTNCTTFDNFSLSSNIDFIIKDLQIWKFVSPFSG